MRIKSHTAESVTEALKQVRSEMGAEAFLLKTRKFSDQLGASKVEVTACVGGDQPFQIESQTKSSKAPNRIAEKLNDENPLPKKHSAPIYGNDLSAVHE